MTAALALPIAAILLGVADAVWAKRRIRRYRATANLQIVSLRRYYGRAGPFFVFRGKHLFRVILKEEGGTFPAWFSSAGFVSTTLDDPREAKFSR